MWQSNIQVHYANLTKGQKKVADYLLENEKQASSMTIRECASGAGVGQPTVLRMLENCNYDGWSQFQQAVWKHSGAKGAEESFLLNELMQKTDSITGKYKESNKEVIRTIQNDVNLISLMASELNLEELSDVVKIIKKAKIVDIYGTDNSANAANELAGRLLHLGLPSRNYSDLFFQKISAGHLGKRDVAIGFSLSGKTKAITKAIKSAGKSGATTVAVTGNPNSPLAKKADYLFLTPTHKYSEEAKWISTRITQIAFVDILCAAIIASDREKFKRELNISTDEFLEDLSESVEL